MITMARPETTTPATAPHGEPTRRPQIVQRDDGMFDVICGENAAGPFPTIRFAMQVASGEKPTPIKAGRFRRFRIVREVQRDAA